ncbi:fungal-specific transcription factor domain-containing protein [Boeremia exigua]|uniref:fungal-specific transcription factor domain-containing protein n=1 Tax=Boeremia exigua TaxID=749465 RepID=UPI001E8E1028|nr:fungal-specific transcription factor domain-containing protein [Boeremia exigua]KAH6639644.1 fungal-specific transcription factor domain-containing protein [Boeremia exigua]
MSTEVSQSLAAAMSRPQIGIDRLPARRVSNEPREAMNCKSCRKRKIKCNRTRPTCEACQVFAVPCVYDAVPKKRGPKTDVLEALLKRVDGLEKRLHSEGKSDELVEELSSAIHDVADNSKATKTSPNMQPASDLSPKHGNVNIANQLMSPIEPSVQTPTLAPDLLLDTYFARIHGKPYYILDEATTRQRLQANQLPSHLAFAIYAVSARYAPHFGGYNAAVRTGSEYARRARLEIDIDEPSIEALQTLMLLAQASFQLGKGKKTFMLLNAATSMAFALDLHRELPQGMKVTPAEREGRRRLFWSCYLMDRFAASGSKRPSLVTDESIVLRLPSWQLHPSAMLLEGDYFPNGQNLQYMGGSGKAGQGSMGMLIGIARILGITNRYLAAGGVKGDSHFPWHSLSNLSKIRQELDIWASDTQDTFTSIEALFGQPDSTILVLSKLVYHLIHCLIYRPFLPVDLAELSGTSQHQPWQIEATNLCFLHANAIAELVEIGRASSIIDWPAFVGYCVCTAGTIHVHGAHYPAREGEVFSVSAEFLSREMQQLSELRFIWAGAQHQRETLQTIYGCHTELVTSLASNPMRFSPVFQLDDFFDRYPGQVFDGSHVTFLDIQVESIHESLATYNIEQRNNMYVNSGIVGNSHGYQQQQHTQPQQRHYSNGQPSKRRRATNSKITPQIQSAPLPTPTSATYPPIVRASRPSDAGLSDTTSNPSPGDTRVNGPTNPPFTPPPNHNTMNMPNTTNGGGNSQIGGLALPFSPNFSFSPLPQFASLAPSPVPRAVNPNPNTDNSMSHFDPMLSMPTPYDQQPTPGAGSTSGASVHTDPDSKDPFLSLLEQLAENEVSHGGPSELDFFLSGQSG